MEFLFIIDTLIIASPLNLKLVPTHDDQIPPHCRLAFRSSFLPDVTFGGAAACFEANYCHRC
ncbi:MAG: hypothetical protein O3A39_01450 [Proteobacteria bacterium]|nr:hypothetical protein [Pseudomonadota bacterium]